MLLINYVALFFRLHHLKLCAWLMFSYFHIFPRSGLLFFLLCVIVLWNEEKQHKLSAKGNDIILRCAKAHNYEIDMEKRTKLSWSIILICCYFVEFKHDERIFMRKKCTCWAAKHELVIWRRLKGFSTKKSNTTIIRLDFHEKLNELCVRTFIPFVFFCFVRWAKSTDAICLRNLTVLSAFEVMRKNLMSLSH